MKVLRWAQPSVSGNGDRFIDILKLCVYARLKRYDAVTMDWPTYMGHEEETTDARDMQFRYEDSKLENIRRYLQFPREVVFRSEPSGPISYWSPCVFAESLGGDPEYHTFQQAYAPECPLTDFLKIARRVSREFVFTGDPQKFATSLPRHAAVHIRRGDKIRSDKMPIDGAYCTDREEAELDGKTRECIHILSALGYRIFICGDDDTKTERFIEYAKSLGNEPLMTPRDLPKWQRTFYDMAAMARSDLIITSQKSSSFSRFAAMIGNGLVRTVYQNRLIDIYPGV